MNMKVGLITYQTPHRKTEEVLQKILCKNYHLKIFALPFIHRKPRKVFFSHRPDQSESVLPEALAQKHDISYTACSKDSDIDFSCEVYLILGAGVLSGDCLKGKKIINCHPGIIPSSRGLDSFKWALYMMKPLGVTLHYINEEVDSGEIISVVPTDVYLSDELESLAHRHYQNEIDCLSRFDSFLAEPSNAFEDIEESRAMKRMPYAQEKNLKCLFDSYKRRYGIC